MITISPGHWVPGTGASDLIDEVAEARKVVKRVVKILRANKITTNHVVDNSSKNQSQNLKYLVNEHNLTSRELDVSVHFNSSSRTDRGLGVEVLYFSIKDLAAKMSKAISEVSGLINRGAKLRKDLAFLNSTNKPAILIEVCFVCSTADIAIYKRDFEKICYAIAQCLAEFVGKPIKKGGSKLDFSSKAMQTKYEMRTSSPATKKLILETAFSIEELHLDRKHWEEQYEKGNIKEGDWNAFAYEVAVHLAKNKYK
ncbi:N-acetylmuramoyl-L-alanine amidase [Lysinibacillus telephonicus]|uniref:N-acetylmuramoyl-L-alanine amidase n=1 Tax=Lysinibacillus telephonicus TaxID=1714840 RepID=UPI0031FD8B46